MIDQEELAAVIAEVYRETRATDPLVAFQRAVHAVRQRYSVDPSTARGWVMNNRPK